MHVDSVIDVKYTAGKIVIHAIIRRSVYDSNSETLSTMRLFGYTRASTSQQSLDAQFNITILSAITEAERQRLLERTDKGRVAAKANDVKFGRKRTIDRQKVIALHDQGLGATDIAKQASIGRSTVYKVLRASTASVRE